nr:sodium-coupled monocarboxylate transporter 1-like [Ciona intestinalis]|eukprot:XP_002120451.1 sodium-coupled monocarboxylate transporter 1-like [Ciona intestinalis]
MSTEGTFTGGDTVSSENKTFSVADYIVFCALFVVAAGIGMFFAIKDRKKKTSENYLLAGRSLSGYPVALSLTASFMSAITVLGTPAEIYVYGTMFWWFALAYTIVVVVTATIITPVFYNIGIASTYEYLEMRFNRTVRVAGTITFIVQTIIYMGMVMYMPALALNKVTGLSLYISIVATSLVCTFYTSIGGMKAVVWNDSVQCIVVWIGFLSIIIKGSMDVGGLDKVFQIANEGGRIDFWQFSLDPRIRHTFWSVSIGGSLMWLSVYGINQSMVQRYLSCKNLKHAQIALYLTAGGLLTVLSLACITGLVMYAVYHNCDPLTNGKVDKSDQLLPYLVLDILSVAPGIPGLFVASAYSGTLSAVSTGINALACCTFEDLIKPLKPNIPGPKAVLISKGLVVMYGLLGLGVAFLASLLDKILTMALKMFGIIGGPLLGLFCLGLLTPVANSTGALVGLLGGLSMGIWLAVGSFIYPPSEEFMRKLPSTTEGCNPVEISNLLMNYTSTSSYATTTSFTQDPLTTSGFSNSLYALSYCHYSTFLVLITWCLGVAVSLLTGGLKSRKTVDSKLLAFNGNIMCCLKDTMCPCYKDNAGYTKGKTEEMAITNKDDNEYVEETV